MKQLYRHPCQPPAAGVVDPRIRLLAGFLLLLLVVSSRGMLFPLQVAAVCVPVTLMDGMPARTMCLRLLHPLFIAMVILMLNVFSGPGQTGPVLMWDRFVLTGSIDGLNNGLLTVCRMFGAVSVALLCSQTMTFTETMGALAWLRVPQSLIDVATFAWRTLFMLYDDAAVVYTAQKNRLGYCGMRRGLASFGAMAGMLVIRAFDNSQAMTSSMRQRGYDGSLPVQRRPRPGFGQFAGLALFALVMTAAWKLQNRL